MRIVAAPARLLATLLLITVVCAVTVSVQQPLPSPQQDLPAVVMPPPGGYSQTGKATVRGRVIAGDTGRPLRRAELRLALTGILPVPITATDDEGRFEFTGLPAGRFVIVATKAGYLPIGAMAGQPTGREVEVAAGQRLEGVELAMQRGSTVVVQVSDDLGGPISGVRVFLQYITFVIPGQRNLQTIRGSDNTSDETDDRGIARFSGVPPGEYYITASPVVVRPQVIGASDSRQLLTLTMYPGTTDFASAQRLKVGAAQDVSVTLPLQVVRGATITGNVRDSKGAPLNGNISLTRPMNPAGDARERPTPLQPDGSFTFDDVMPGDYVLTAIAALPTDNPGARELNRARVRVNGEDVRGLVLSTSPEALLRGRIVFEGGTPPGPPGLTSVSVYAGDDALLPQIRTLASVNPDWTFEIGVIGRAIVRTIQLDPAISRRSIGGPPGWYLKEVRYDGRDITDTPLEFDGPRAYTNIEILLTQKRGELTGTVADARGAAVKSYAVVAFPEDPKLRYPNSRFIVAGRSDDQGRFRLRGLAPGRYLVSAVPSLQEYQEYDPELISQLQADAESVSVSDGDVRTLALRLRQ